MAECTLASNVMETTSRSRCIFKTRQGWNRRTMKSRVLSDVHFLKDLDYLLPLCNKDTSPVTPML
ncbi:hypothetical protein Hanom_Chr16g01426201 [Helianthus anomalus]